MIRIARITEASKSGRFIYQLEIPGENRFCIYFDHDPSDGLATCLRLAANEVEAKQKQFPPRTPTEEKQT